MFNGRWWSSFHHLQVWDEVWGMRFFFFQVWGFCYTLCSFSKFKLLWRFRTLVKCLIQHSCFASMVVKLSFFTRLDFTDNELLMYASLDIRNICISTLLLHYIAPFLSPQCYIQIKPQACSLISLTANLEALWAAINTWLLLVCLILCHWVYSLRISAKKGIIATSLFYANQAVVC